MSVIGDQPRVSLQVWVPADWIPALQSLTADSVAGEVRRTLYRSLRCRGCEVSRWIVPTVEGHRSERLQRRRERYRRRRRLGEVARDRLLAVRWWFDDRSVWSSDCDQELALVCIEPARLGEIMLSSTRWGLAVILRELRDVYVVDGVLHPAWVAAVHRYEGTLDAAGRTSYSQPRIDS